MSQQCAPLQVDTQSVQRLRAENAELLQYLDAQRKVIASLERRVGRSLESLGVHVNRLVTSAYVPVEQTSTLQASTDWQGCLGSVQGEVDSLCDLLSDAMLLQKLEAGKAEVNLEAIALEPVLVSASRHLLVEKYVQPVRLICELDALASLPRVLIDHELTEAVVADLLARSLKYSDVDLPVVLGVRQVGDYVHVCVTAQRFAPQGNRDFATEMILCCRRIEVQQGKVSCHHRSDGLQTVTIALRIATDEYEDLNMKN